MEAYETIAMVDLFLATAGSHTHFLGIDAPVDTRLDDESWVLVEVRQPVKRAALPGSQRRVRILGEDLVLLFTEALQLGGHHRHIHRNGSGAPSLPILDRRLTAFRREAQPQGY